MSYTNELAKQIFVELMMIPSKDEITQAQVSAVRNLSEAMTNQSNGQDVLNDLKLFTKAPEVILAKAKATGDKDLINEIQNVITMFEESRQSELQRSN